jgi:hypothetical protein
MRDDDDRPEPLSHKIVVIIVREVAEQGLRAASAAFGRWHRDRLARKREQAASKAPPEKD